MVENLYPNSAPPWSRGAPGDAPGTLGSGANHASAANESPSGRCLSQKAGGTRGPCGNCMQSPQMISRVGQAHSRAAAAASAAPPLAFRHGMGKVNLKSSFSSLEKERVDSIIV